MLPSVYNVVDLHGFAAESGRFVRFSVVSPSTCRGWDGLGRVTAIDRRRALRTFRTYTEKGSAMDAIGELAKDERTARVILAVGSEPRDAVTGRLVGKLGAVETARLLARSTHP